MPWLLGIPSRTGKRLIICAFGQHHAQVSTSILPVLASTWIVIVFGFINSIVFVVRD